MHFESQVFELAKDTEHPEQNQDAWAFDGRRGVAAIADGVSSSLFARQWARILTEAAIAQPPDPDDPEQFRGWLLRCREAWSGRIDASKLAWFQKAKMRDGAFSTLLWISLVPEPSGDGAATLHACAVGDSCLFLVRGGKTRRSFPVEDSQELEANPLVLGSLDLKRDHLVRFQRLEEKCLAGDLLVLCTDAVAGWALRQHEAGNWPAWDDYWSMSEETWQQEVVGLRERREMRYDDATLLLLRVTAPGKPEAGELAHESSASEPAVEPGHPSAETSLGEWKEKLKSLSGQVADRVTEGVSQGAERLKEAGKTMESTWRKYRDKLRPDDR
jgi:hypothetical protein